MQLNIWVSLILNRVSVRQSVLTADKYGCGLCHWGGVRTVHVCTQLFTSRISGRGHRIGAVCPCVCALSRLNRFTYGQEI